MRNWSNEEIERYLGTFSSCHLSHSTEEATRNGAASGGTTSQLAIDMLEAGYVDGVLVWRLILGEDSPRTEARIATTRQEILDARTSLYCSVSWPRDALPLVRSFSGQLAVVTLPCDASYLRRKMLSDAALREKIKCILTLYCGHNSTPELTELVVRKISGASWREVEAFSYRTGSWRGRLTFRIRSGKEFDVPTSTFTKYQNLHFFSERKCLGCVDHYGYEGDISLGDIWSQGDRLRTEKPTSVVLRTARGRELFSRFSGNLEVEDCDPAKILDGNSRGMTYHYNLTARAQAARLFGIKIPDRIRLPTTALQRFVALIALFNFWSSTHPRFKGIVTTLPGFLVRLYLIFFKGLQQLSLLLYRPPPTVEKFSIIGATLIGNRGGEAMLVTTIAKLRQALPGARFIIHSYFPASDERLCRASDVEVVSATPLSLVLVDLPFALVDRLLRFIGMRWPRSLMPRAARELAQSRALIDLSGVAYCDGREKFLPFNLLCNLPALCFDVPLVKLSQGMGPFRGTLNRLCACFVLQRCERVFARGKESLEFCAELGLGDRLELASDVAFQFQPEDSLSEENPDFADLACRQLEDFKAADKKILFLACSSVVLGKCQELGSDYIGTMAAVADEYMQRGFAVVLLPNATREGLETTRNNDLPVLIEIAGRVRTDPANLLLIDRDLNTASLRRILALGDALVASRFHAMIAGLSLGIPTLVLGWGHKYRELLAQFDCTEMAIDFSQIATEPLIERIDDLLERTEEIARTLAQHQPAVQESSNRQFRWLTEYLCAQQNPCTDD